MTTTKATTGAETLDKTDKTDKTDPSDRTIEGKDARTGATRRKVGIKSGSSGTTDQKGEIEMTEEATVVTRATSRQGIGRTERTQTTIKDPRGASDPKAAATIMAARRTKAANSPSPKS